MLPETLSPVLKLSIFALGVAPLLIDNLRTGRVTNLNNAILFVAGLAAITVDWSMNATDRSLPSLTLWIGLGALALVALFSIAGFPGGVVKTLVAFLPWFTLSDYFLVVTAGFVLCTLAGYLTRREAVPLVPFFALAGAAALLHRVFSGSLA